MAVINLNDTTPPAPAGKVNARWQADALSPRNISVYVDPRVYVRTLLIKNPTVGNDIADHVTIYGAGTAKRVVGVLRKPLGADLTIRINRAGIGPLIACTIPLATAIDTPVVFTVFALTPQPLADGDVLTFDVIASDGQESDAAGIAVFTIDWS